MGKNDARHVHVFVTGIAIVSQKHAFTTVLERLRDAGIEVVGFDEVVRRIVLRSPARLTPVLENYARTYFTEFSFEVKGIIKNRSTLKGLSRLGRVQRTSIGGRLLGLYDCGKALVWFELDREKALVKYCRRSLYRDPASYPQGLCSYTLADRPSLVEAVGDAVECFGKLVEESMLQITS